MAPPLLSNTTLGDMRDTAFTLRGQSIAYITNAFVNNNATGDVSQISTEYTIAEALTSGKVKGEAFERSFRIRTADLPEGAPKTTDAIRYQNYIWRVVDYRSDDSEYVYHIETRRM